MTLAVSSVAAIGTWVQVLQNRRNAVRELDKRNALNYLRNIESAARDGREALGRVRNVFESQQNRKLENRFEGRPRFGNFTAEFSIEELDEFEQEVQDLERNLSMMRYWSRASIRVSANASIPNEGLLVEELGEITENMNAALFGDVNYRDQLRILDSSLERIERACAGAQRRN